MKVLDANHSTFFDVDNTLVDWDPSIDDLINYGVPIDTMMPEGLVKKSHIVPHGPHIQALKLHKLRNHTIFVWSAGGAAWAARVVRALKLEDYVDYVLEKPIWAYDDQSPEEYMPKSKWLNK